MLNCPECGLTLTDAQKECPKCHTKIEDVKEKAVEKEVKETPKRKRGRPKKTETVEKKEEKKTEEVAKNVKEEMIKAVIEAEEEAASAEVVDEKIQREEAIIAAAVEAEALAVIEEEAAEAEAYIEAADDEFLCETCLAPVEEGQNFCQLCGQAVEAVVANEAPLLPKTDEEANKWIAAIGYVLFFLPILFGYYRKSKFAKYHATQAVYLFIASTGLFLGLVAFRNLIDSLFNPFLMTNVDGSFLSSLEFSWQHGTGVIFYFYLVAMILILHLIPFALMLIGITNAVQGKKKPLPLIGRLLKITGQTKSK